MNKYTNLFIRQSYLDAYNEYAKSLLKKDYPAWDYVVLTASNEAQAEAYRAQIAFRLRHEVLRKNTEYLVLSDPSGERVGSGGATLNVLRHIRSIDSRPFDELKILVIHSGGDSKRVPQYSACGKLFSPVPRMLPDGRRSTLFDEFIISFTGIPARLSAGMMVASGDVLLLFNPLQIDFYGAGAAALSIKENVTTGCHHGVYLKDDNGNVGRFLHKQDEEKLRALGAVDARGNIDIDTGAVFFDHNMVNDLYALVSTEEGFRKYVNSVCRLSFYADFSYPLSENATLSDYLLETPEGEFSDALTECRKVLWETLHKYRMKLIRFSPAAFIHFGTTKELLELLTERIDDFLFLDWNGIVGSNVSGVSYSVSNSYIAPSARIGYGAYIEDSYIFENVTVEPKSIVSTVTLRNITVPKESVLHGLKLNDGRYVVRMYGVADNPKEAQLFGRSLPCPLWNLKFFPIMDSMEDACQKTLEIVSRVITDGVDVLKEYEGYTLTDLCESYSLADTNYIIEHSNSITDYINAERLVDAARKCATLEEAKAIFPFGLTGHAEELLKKRVEDFDLNKKDDFSVLLRIDYFLASLTEGAKSEEYMDKCFRTLSEAIMNKAISGIRYNPDLRIAKDEVITTLPVRVNFGGGWSDTPPYCLEHGGTVLNAAIKLYGKEPVEVVIRKTDKKVITLASADNGSYKEFTSLEELRDCFNPYDTFALHKAALIVMGVIPMNGDMQLSDILDRIGGGFYLSTQVINIPRGSGLGTSSILSAACVKGLAEFFGLNSAGASKITDDELYSRVLCIEQLMSTGGGWQDQVGGLAPGIKLITSNPGLLQTLQVETLSLSPETLKELNERFCIVYTGQRRLARHLLREIVGRYIASDTETLYVLDRIKVLAESMKHALIKGDLDLFASLLNEHWEMSKRLDSECTNTCIDQIFVVCEGLIDGRMICGAGGGGFIQIMLKKGVTKEDLRERLDIIFADSGVEVWDCEF